ncbi:hypothetical protein BpHYR1_046692 [Brachionus plicatilis]|uniref:Uncharacterized protein n=1 Tax=Brachionus plicatilis TaxID=10195 RepID=A0A3M7RVT1_BRAPC|nr:hypothetical protein BpHYR1_046692 [Brachionus plicatilis]
MNDPMLQKERIRKKQYKTKNIYTIFKTKTTAPTELMVVRLALTIQHEQTIWSYALLSQKFQEVSYRYCKSKRI